MKQYLIAAAVIAATLTTPAIAADVGVSVSIGQPGFYGRLDIGDYPPPQLIYRQPKAIWRVPRDRPPVYLRVPPGHRKHWSRYCREYNACGERVYFVQDNWYHQEYVPRYQKQHREYRDQRGDGRGEHGNKGNDHGDKGRGGNERHDNGQGHGRNK